jgi:hypothetical protein
VALSQHAASVPKVSMGMECCNVSNYLNCEFADTGIVVALFIASTSEEIIVHHYNQVLQSFLNTVLRFHFKLLH